ncbi:hypothetical protein [uncultured Schumannella sp.]|uniref:hypothetical protein n=1 Tax=uncultured Schumannella sp. TaxID=1195956 RepID=UPI0025CF99BB|nr:hypothetical protein [uncultured Schumannella sp.]
MIDVVVATGHPVLTCCRVVGVSLPWYYRYKHRSLAPATMRHQWLIGLTQEVHTASRETYGYRLVHAELSMGMGVSVSSRLTFLLMRDAGSYGLPGPTRIKRLRADRPSPIKNQEELPLLLARVFLLRHRDISPVGVATTAGVQAGSQTLDHVSASPDGISTAKP